MNASCSGFSPSSEISENKERKRSSCCIMLVYLVLRDAILCLRTAALFNAMTREAGHINKEPRFWPSYKHKFSRIISQLLRLYVGNEVERPKAVEEGDTFLRFSFRAVDLGGLQHYFSVPVNGREAMPHRGESAVNLFSELCKLT